MKKILHSTKKFIALTLVLAMLISANCFSFLGLGLTHRNQRISASAVAPTSITINNSNFTESSDKNYPKAPRSWTTDGVDAGNITKGIISLERSSYNENYSEKYDLSAIIPTYEGMNDNDILMINSSSSAKYAYVSGAVTLSASSYYILRFKAWTENGAFATCELYDNGILSANENSSMNIATNEKWVTCSYFIETDDINSVSANIKLWLGNKNEQATGAVFFDDVTLFSYTNDNFNSILTASSNNSSNIVKYVSLKDNRTYETIKNGSFENDLEGWTIKTEGNSVVDSKYVTTGVFNVDENFNSTQTNVSESPTNANIYKNSKALLINNTNVANGVAIGYRSSAFTIKQFGQYKLSVLVKTGNLTNTARIGLIQKDDETKTYFNNSVSTSSNTNANTNDWITYSFLISGDKYQDKDVYLELWLGSENSLASGYVFFDNITLEKLNSEDYSKASSSSNVTTADLSNITGSPTVSNGAFNDIVANSATQEMPFEPKNWTKSTSKTTAMTKSGIVNTSSFNIDGVVNPGSTYNDSAVLNNNILMVGNINSQCQSYRSSAITLSTADSYYTVSVKVKTQKLVNTYAFIKLSNSTNTLSEFTKIESNDAWTAYSFNIYNKTANTTVYLTLGLGDFVEGTGYAFFDDAKLVSSDETTYTTSSNTSKAVNLKLSDFSIKSENSTNGLYESYDYTKQNNSATSLSAITTGIIDTNNFLYPNNYLSGLTNPNAPEGDNGFVLMIGAGQDSFYSYKSNESFDLTAGSYYKITVQVKTRNITQDEQNRVETSEDTQEYYIPGASITLNGLEDKGFTAINTDGEWKTYEIYINCTEAGKFNLELGLGYKNALTSGEAYFASAEMTTIDNEKYIEIVKKLDEDDTIDNIMTIGNTDLPAEEDTNTPANNNVSFNWLVVPSLITAVAIILSVIAYLLAWANKKRPEKINVKPTDYNIETYKLKEHKYVVAIKDKEDKLNILQAQYDENLVALTKLDDEYKQKEIDATNEINNSVVADTQDGDVESPIENKQELIDKRLEELKAEKQLRKLEISENQDSIKKEIAQLLAEQEQLTNDIQDFKREYKKRQAEQSQKTKDKKSKKK